MKIKSSNPFWDLFITILFGLGIGILTYLFIEALKTIEIFHNQMNSGVPYHLLFIPLILFLIDYIKKNTLYFPARAASLADENSSQFWSVFMAPIHFFGTLFSHAAGVSVGRESAAVLFASGLVRLFRLNWLFWGPVSASIGFSAVVGQFWVAPFFMKEMFGYTSSNQKIFSFIGSMTAVLFMQSLGAGHLFTHYEIQAEMGFFQKLVFLFLFAVVAGYLMRGYKKIYRSLSVYFSQRPIWVRLMLASVLMVFLALPEFRKFQSLGISQFSDLSSLTSSFYQVFVKLFVTLISTTLGFLGGEFIPLVYSGTHFGAAFFDYFGHNPLMGAALGAYLLFIGATRFKWTGYVLILNLLGLSWWFWAYFIVAITLGFSGPYSIYKKN